MATSTFPYQGPFDQFLVSDYVVTTAGTAPSTYATMYTLNPGQRGILGAIRLRAIAGLTAGTERYTFRILRADGSTTKTLAVTPALNTAQGTSGAFGGSQLGDSLTYTVPAGLGGLGSGFTVNYTLNPGDSLQVAQTSDGTANNEYHIDVTALLVP